MSRLVYQTSERHDSSWFDYIQSHGRKENSDSRDNSISIRMTLSTLTYACFYKLDLLFLFCFFFADPEYLQRRCLVNSMKFI